MDSSRLRKMGNVCTSQYMDALGVSFEVRCFRGGLGSQKKFDVEKV